MVVTPPERSDRRARRFKVSTRSLCRRRLETEVAAILFVNLFTKMTCVTFEPFEFEV